MLVMSDLCALKIFRLGRGIDKPAVDRIGRVVHLKRGSKTNQSFFVCGHTADENCQLHMCTSTPFDSKEIQTVSLRDDLSRPPVGPSSSCRWYNEDSWSRASFNAFKSQLGLGEFREDLEIGFLKSRYQTLGD